MRANRIRAAVPHIILGTAALVALGLIASRAGFVPLWDGRGYADCAIEAANNGFRPYFLRCYGHPSHIYVMLTGLAHRLATGSPVPFLAVDSLLFAAASVAFYRLTRLVLPGPERSMERAGATAAFVLQPSFLAMAVQPNIDVPVLAGFLWCLVTLIERRWVWTVLVGLATVFSKETGALLYGLTIACYGAWRITREPGNAREKIRMLVGMTPLATPVVVFAVYLAAYVILRPTANVLWEGESLRGGILRQFIIPRFDDVTASYAFMIFALNFAWIPALVVAVDAASALRARVRGAPRAVVGVDGDIVLLMSILTVVVIYFLTRFATFTNARYVSVALAMLLALFAIALARLNLPSAARSAVVVVYLVVLAGSAVRTIDPVSRLAFGTFRVGAHAFLRMTSITNECCGPNGRDQLAYNLQFTVFDDLIGDALAAVRGPDGLTIVVPEAGGWHTIGPTDPTSGRRTLGTTGVREPRVFEDVVLLAGEAPLPVSAWYFALPNHDASGLGKLAASYAIGPERRVDRRGYTMSFFPMIRAARSGSR